ncbi:hypothetical protein N7495_009862 [Penicillium taxi]|uniref:uncharacterized protein n=1 Tax=Penicillium taxi TaxID=168475 RepID=UPI0025458636|nr:uncharacterized protein N7495_009862 [Penicillium taxi]KAJ5885352.1 hypothetical protein N7495_009862 [Penicillium taxi]
MTPSHSLVYLLSLVLTFSLLPSTLAAPWIVTGYYEEVTSTVYDYYYYYETSTPEVTRIIEAIIPTATPLPAAVSTVVVNPYSNTDITIVEKLYPTGAGKVQVYSYDYDYDNVVTVWVVNMTFSAPTGCSTAWTTTTAATVYPSETIKSLLPKTAVSTSLSVDTRIAFQPTTYTYDYIFVDPTQIPSSSLAALSNYNYPSDLYTGNGCYYTSVASNYGTDEDGSYTTGTYGNSNYYSYGDDDYNWFISSYWGISLLAITLITLLGWIGVMLIAGFIEAWIRFRRLMTGWQTRRGLPVFWSLTLLPLSLFLLFAFKKGYRARSAEDAEVLRQKWKEMSFWTKLRLFFVWGFRFKYPPMLGEAPPRVEASKRPQKNPRAAVPNAEQPLVSGATAQQSRPGSADRAVPAVETRDPEMGEVNAEQRSTRENGAEASGALIQSQEERDIGRVN